MQVLAHNLAAQFTNRQLNITTNPKAKSSEKLSSGYRINRSADDAAGLSISEKMRKQVRGLNQASENVQDGISLCQVADGALGETTEILQRMRKLSVQAANGTNSESDRSAIQQEIDQLTKEVDRIADTTSFNQTIYPLNDKEPKIVNRNTEIIDPNYAVKKITLTMTSHPDSTGTIDGKSIVGPVTFGAVKIGSVSYLWDTGVTDDTDLKAGALIQRGYDDRETYSLNINELQIDTKGRVYFISKYDRMMSYIVMNKDKGTISCVTNSPWLINSHEELLTATGKRVTMEKRQESDSIWIQAGADTGDGLTLSMVNATAKGLGIKEPDISVMSEANCDDAMNRLGDAIEKVSSYRSLFGAQQNRLECAKAIDDNTAENTTAAESRIRDTDMAKEMVGFSKNNILAQVGQSMLAQANQSTQGILSLLQ